MASDLSEINPLSTPFSNSTFVHSKIFNNKGKLSHVLKAYDGTPMAFHGDSGGGLISKNAEGNYAHSGLWQYAGTIKDNSSQKTMKAVGILLMRPDIIDSLKKSGTDFGSN